MKTLLTILLLSLTACEALIPAALGLGSSLLSSAANNYSPRYGKDVQKLLETLRDEITEQVTGKQPPHKTGAKALSLDVAVLRQTDIDGRVVAQPVRDGDVLRGEPRQDRFKVYFKSDSQCYVYVILIDGTGWVQPLFPGELSSIRNPVGAGARAFLPEGELAFALDEHKGIETLYFVVSRTPRPNLEKMLAAFASRERGTPASAQRVNEPIVMDRGIGQRQAGTPAKVRTRSGSQPFETTRVLASMKTADLVLTRWFRYE